MFIKLNISYFCRNLLLPVFNLTWRMSGIGVCLVSVDWFFLLVLLCHAGGNRITKISQKVKKIKLKRRGTSGAYGPFIKQKSILSRRKVLANVTEMLR